MSQFRGLTQQKASPAQKNGMFYAKCGLGALLGQRRPHLKVGGSSPQAMARMEKQDLLLRGPLVKHNNYSVITKLHCNTATHHKNDCHHLDSRST